VYKRGMPSAGRAGPLLQYSFVLGRLKMEERDRPTAVQTAASCQILSQFTVGITEQMDSFLVLVALENRWPLEEMCYYKSHVNKARPKRQDFQPEVDLIPNSLLFFFLLTILLLVTVSLWFSSPGSTTN
jgi:hypothetical protein